MPKRILRGQGGQAAKEAIGPASAPHKFKGYRPETERITRVPEVKNNTMIRRIERIWRACTEGELFNMVPMCRMDKLNHSAKDIEAFSLYIEGLQGNAQFSKGMGEFLSNLINRCKDGTVIIHTAHLSERISGLGFMNTRHIVIKGDAGWKLGWDMTSGSITVEGDTEGEAGLLLEGGTITIKGNAGIWLGHKMTGGLILVEGDAGDQIGTGMEGGEIRVGGKISGALGGVWGGKIYQGGDLILDQILDQKALDDYKRENDY
jgi:formylmethanofuran dehydrogenase subunit C